jgi:hypothetical protein
VKQPFDLSQPFRRHVTSRVEIRVQLFYDSTGTDLNIGAGPIKKEE